MDSGEAQAPISVEAPEELCGVEGCAYLPHEGSHSWEAGRVQRI
jgi:hypothetical protein